MFLDTTILIDFLHCEEKAIKIIKSLESQPLYTSEINIFELFRGAYLYGKDISRNIRKIETLASKLLVLNFDRKAALKSSIISAELSKKGQKIGETDCLIAGIALSNGIKKFVTNNKKHFERIPNLEVISY